MYRGLCSLPQLRYPRTLPNLSSSTISNQLRTGWKRPTSTIGLNKSGFIDLAPGEGLPFFDNVFPLKTAAYDIRYYLARHDKQSIRSLIKSRYIPKSLAESGFTILDVFPRLKDGGAIVKFTAPSPDKVESTIAEYLKASNFRPWFSPFKRIKAYKVRGEPWLEDLYRFPSARLKVEFIGGGLNQEVVYALFRRYGKIADIISRAPASSKFCPSPPSRGNVLLQNNVNPLRHRHDRAPNGVLKALGLWKRMKTVYHKVSPDTAGMIMKVKELLAVSEVDTPLTQAEIHRKRQPPKGLYVERVALDANTGVGDEWGGA